MSKSGSARDQGETPFSSILTELCRAAGAKCAALVDREGETVDYGGRGDPFDIRILAAEWRLVLQYLEGAKHLGQSQQFSVRAQRKSFLVVPLPEGYALVAELARRATGASDRAVNEAFLRLCEEAGFNTSETQWRRVKVTEERGHSRRPESMSVEGEGCALTVLGRIASENAPKERSFRVRLATGEERTLVREPLGHWYLEKETFPSE